MGSVSRATRGGFHSLATCRLPLGAKLRSGQRFLAASRAREARCEVRVTQQFYKNMALWVVILLMILLLVTMLRQSQAAPAEIPFSKFLAQVDAGEVASVTIEEGRIEGRLSSGQPFTTYAPAVTDKLLESLEAKNVEVTARPARESPMWQQILIMWFPFLLLIGLWIFFMRQVQAGGGKAMSFGKSRARLLNESHNRVTFADVAGVDESKAELEEIIAFLRDPKK